MSVVSLAETSSLAGMARMAALQEELAQIERRLESLRAGEGGCQHPDASLRINNNNNNNNDNDNDNSESVDPAVAHMLAVELCQLAASGDIVGVHILLNGGADTDSRDYDERTPLHIASSKGHASVVGLLLEYGADYVLTDKEGKTALELAEENGCDDVVQLLISHGAAQNENDSSGKMENSSLDSPFTPNHPDFSQIPQPMMGSLIVIMVGLPGRGKTYIARQIQRYFQWNGLQSKIFTHSDYASKLEPECSTFNNMTDAECHIASVIAHDMTHFIAQTDSVAVLDGANCSPMRRVALLNAIKERRVIRPNRIVFVEVVTNDVEKVRLNVNHVKEMFPNPPEDFFEKYYEDIEKHEAIYKSLNATTDKDVTYIKIDDQLVFSLNNISGWMPSRLVYMLHNLSHSPGNIYLTRAGEYFDLVDGRIGGNSRLTERGKAYSEALFEYFKKEQQMNPFIVMSSCAIRCTETVQYFEEQSMLLRSSSPHISNDKPQLNCRVSYLPTLDDINHGDCDGQLLSDVRKTMPSTLKRMEDDPYHTAWPNGECMHQVFNARLEPHIHDIQASTDPVLIVSHLHLLQGLYSYFVSENDNFIEPQNAYKIDIPFECVIKIRLVGVNRVAEVIDLSKNVDEIYFKRTGKYSKAPQQGSLNIFRRFNKK